MRALNVLRGMSAEEVRLMIVLGAGGFMLASSLNSINVALPVIQEEFDISLSALKWVSIIGAIMMASLSLCFGRVGDIVGRKKIYRLGIFLYAFGALLTATSFSFGSLMGFRVIMAVGLAMSNPLAAAIMAATVAPERRGQVLGLFASFAAAGQLMGPSLGGFVMDAFGWRAIFLAYTGIGLALVVGQHFLLKGVDERRPSRFDYTGAALLLVGYPALLIALSVGPGYGWGSATTIFWFVFAGIGLSSFLLRESRFEAPIFHLRFFRSFPFCIAMFTLIVASFVQSPISLFTPIYLQKVLTINPTSVGLVMMALPISTLIAGPIGGRLADRYNARVMAAIGAAITFVAVLFYSRLGLSTPYLFVVIPLVLIGIGGGFFRPANQVAVYATVDRRDYGALSAMLISIGTLAGTLGTTITVAINDTRSTVSDAAAFVDGQQFSFTALLPLLLLSVFISLIGRGSAPLRDREDAAAAAAPASAERVR